MEFVGFDCNGMYIPGKLTLMCFPQKVWGEDSEPSQPVITSEPVAEASWPQASATYCAWPQLKEKGDFFFGGVITGRQIVTFSGKGNTELQTCALKIITTFFMHKQTFIRISSNNSPSHWKMHGNYREGNHGLDPRSDTAFVRIHKWKNFRPIIKCRGEKRGEENSP